MYESYCELCLDKCGRILSKLVSRLLQVEKWRKFRTKHFCIVSSCSCQLELVYTVWYTKMKFATTKLITSKSQTKSKTIPNQELSISPKFNGKKDTQKHQKSRQAQQKSSWSIHLETWKLKQTQMRFGPKLSPGEIFTSPKKKHYQNQSYLFLWTSLLPKKIAWVQQKHPSNQVPQTDVICKLDKWSKDCPSPRFSSGLQRGNWRIWGEDGRCRALRVPPVGWGKDVWEKVDFKYNSSKIPTTNKRIQVLKKVKIFCWVVIVGMMWSFTTNQPPYLPRVKHRCSKRTCSIHHVGHWVLALQRSLQHSICDQLNLWLFYLGRSSI